MSDDRSAPSTIEQVAINNMVNIETLLECLIESGVIQEDKFAKTKAEIEARIISAQQRVVADEPQT